MLDMIDILKSVQGVDEEGNPKSGISMTEYLVDTTEQLHKKREKTFATPIIKMCMNGKFVILDLIFPKTEKRELKIVWYLLKSFSEKQNELIGELEAAILEFLVVPLKYKGRYFFSLINPIFWSLQPSEPGLPIDSIRILFEQESMRFLEGDEVDENEIIKTIESKEEEKMRIAEIEEQRQIDREEYLSKLNSRFNKMDQ